MQRDYRKLVAVLVLNVLSSAGHAQSTRFDQLRNAYTACVNEAFKSELRQQAVGGNVRMAVERSFGSCQGEENVYYSTLAYAMSDPSLARLLVDQHKTRIKAAIVNQFSAAIQR